MPGLFLWFGGWLYFKLRHREGLGLGDVKLVAMVGAFLGLHGALLMLIGGSLAGSLIGYAYIKLTHKDPGHLRTALRHVFRAGGYCRGAGRFRCSVARSLKRAPRAAASHHEKVQTPWRDS